MWGILVEKDARMSPVGIVVWSALNWKCVRRPGGLTDVQKKTGDGAPATVAYLRNTLNC
jgi:hypothetical protein